MPRKALIYCLKVWLTSLLLTPFIVYFLIVGDDLLKFFTFYWLSALLGLVFSLPSAVLLWVYVAWFLPGDSVMRFQKLTVAGISLVLIALPFSYFAFSKNPVGWDEWLKAFFCYWVILLAGIYFYHFPAKTPT